MKYTTRNRANTWTFCVSVSIPLSFVLQTRLGNKQNVSGPFKVVSHFCDHGRVSVLETEGAMKKRRTHAIGKEEENK